MWFKISILPPQHQGGRLNENGPGKNNEEKDRKKGSKNRRKWKKKAKKEGKTYFPQKIFKIFHKKTICFPRWLRKKIKEVKI